MDMRESDHPGFLEVNPGSALRTELDRDFGNDDKEKLKYITAQLEAKQAQLYNLGQADAIYHTDQDLDRIVDYPAEISELETVKNELEAIVAGSEEKDVIEYEDSVN